jgi:hypothetical protein
MISQGLVGFFDILGYQNIVDNNTIEEVSEIITGLLLKLPDIVRSNMKESFSEKIRPGMEARLGELRATLISDSILLVFPVDRKKNIWEKILSFALFKSYVERLIGAMFREGLPMRGAVDFGDYFVADRSFAGKPIIDCYRLGQSLDFSGCVITKRCATLMDLLVKEAREEDRAFASVKPGYFGYDYLCPVRDQKWESYRLIDWSLYTGDEIHDVRESVFTAFKDHNKDIGLGVARKMENTEMMLRFFKRKWKAVAVKAG